MAMVGGGFAVFGLFILAMGIMAIASTKDNPLPVEVFRAMERTFVRRMYISLFFLLMSTLLGWIAVSQIRRSAGKLYGLGLAVFDGLLFSLLVVDMAILGCLTFLAMKISSDTPYFIILVRRMAVFCLVMSNIFFVRWVWKKTEKVKCPKSTIWWASIFFGIALLIAWMFVNATQTITSPPAPRRPSFGQVIERTIPNPAKGAPCLLDFETGNRLVPPDELAIKLADGMADIGESSLPWLRKSGADACVKMPPRASLRLFEGVAQSIAHNSNPPIRFNAFTPDEVLEVINGAGSELSERFVDRSRGFYETPAVAPGVGMAFITREGTMGVMEITGPATHPSGVKIRYKLIRP